MTISSTEERIIPVPKITPPLPCDPTSDRPLGLELNGEELKEFFRALNVDWTIPLNRDYEILGAVHRVFEEEVESGRYPPEALPSIKALIEKATGLTGHYFYAHLPSELKVQIGVYTTLVLEIDDLAERDPETMIPAIEVFIGAWGGQNSIKHHPCLEHIMRNVTVDLRKWFGPLSLGNIVHSTIGFLQGTLLEAAYPVGVPCPTTASRYPMYLRIKAGISEPYAHFLFPETMFPEKEYFETYIPSITDITEWINLVNDILSFFKESVVGPHQNTYLMTLAKALGRDPVDVWRDTAKSQMILMDEITATLSRKEELKQVWLPFINGYCRFHCTQYRRYRLQEIGISLT